jgi:hypothetical protein
MRMGRWRGTIGLAALALALGGCTREDITSVGGDLPVRGSFGGAREATLELTAPVGRFVQRVPVAVGGAPQLYVGAFGAARARMLVRSPPATGAREVIEARLEFDVDEALGPSVSTRLVVREVLEGWEEASTFVDSLGNFDPPTVDETRSIGEVELAPQSLPGTISIPLDPAAVQRVMATLVSVGTTGFLVESVGEGQLFGVHALEGEEPERAPRLFISYFSTTGESEPFTFTLASEADSYYFVQAPEVAPIPSVANGLVYEGDITVDLASVGVPPEASLSVGTFHTEVDPTRSFFEQMEVQLVWESRDTRVLAGTMTFTPDEMEATLDMSDAVLHQLSDGVASPQKLIVSPASRTSNYERIVLASPRLSFIYTFPPSLD